MCIMLSATAFAKTNFCPLSTPKGDDAAVGGGLAAPNPKPFPKGDAAGTAEGAVEVVGVG